MLIFDICLTYGTSSPKLIISSIGSAPSGRAALDEETRNIPPLRYFSSQDKAKIISAVIKVVPKDYVEQFPPVTDAQFGAMQETLLDVSMLYMPLPSWYFNTLSNLSLFPAVTN